MRGLLILLVLVSSFLPQQLFAQEDSSSQPDKPDKIRGTVINQLTRQPIARALVFSSDNRLAAFSDDEGRFEFSVPIPEAPVANNTISTFSSGRQGMSWGYPAGSYLLRVKKPGFLEDPDLPPPPSSRGSDISIALLPEAIIHGRVLISEADSAAGIAVELFKRQVQEGMPRWMPLQNMRTDSGGEFRFAELPPGSYKVMTQELLDNDPADMVPRGQLYGFPPRCFPGTPDFDTGATIQLGAGQDFEANISLFLRPYYPVSLPVANGDSGGGVSVTVSPEGRSGPGYSLGYNAARHTVNGLLPDGTYRVELRSSMPAMAGGSATVTVAGAPAQGPAIVLTPAVPIPITVSENFTSEWNGNSSWNINGHNYTVQGPRAYLWVSLESVDEFNFGGQAGLAPPRFDRDERLVLENVLPGRYWVRFNTGRGYVQSITYGGVDVMRQPLVVGAGSPPPIEISLRGDAATLEGSVEGIPSNNNSTPDSASQNGAGQASAYIYCIPLSESGGSFVQTQVMGDGEFHSEIAPGTYKVLAFSRPHDQLPYRDPPAMSKYENRGQVVQLTPGATVKLQLQLVADE